MKHRQISNMRFHIDDAQQLKEIESNSIDVVINIESAFHYPDKSEFIKQINRVLKPGGTFVIADLLTTKKKGIGIRKIWKKSMVQNHWKKSRYESEFDNSALQRHHSIDITRSVIHGFKNYRKWIRGMRKFGFLRDLVFKIFYHINVQLTLYFLKYRRQYFVFVGTKPVK
jgi:ubiquinone/menaquinone biosynthesis C-methylase UbiE